MATKNPRVSLKKFNTPSPSVPKISVPSDALKTRVQRQQDIRSRIKQMQDHVASKQTRRSNEQAPQSPKCSRKLVTRMTILSVKKSPRCLKPLPTSPAKTSQSCLTNETPTDSASISTVVDDDAATDHISSSMETKHPSDWPIQEENLLKRLKDTKAVLARHSCQAGLLGWHSCPRTD